MCLGLGFWKPPPPQSPAERCSVKGIWFGYKNRAEVMVLYSYIIASEESVSRSRRLQSLCEVWGYEKCGDIERQHTNIIIIKRKSVASEQRCSRSPIYGGRINSRVQEFTITLRSRAFRPCFCGFWCQVKWKPQKACLRNHDSGRSTVVTGMPTFSLNVLSRFHVGQISCDHLR